MSSLRDLYIDETYQGVLHAGGVAIPNVSTVPIYDGDGNKTSISIGRENNGLTVTGTVTSTDASITTLTAGNIASTTITNSGVITSGSLTVGNITASGTITSADITVTGTATLAALTLNSVSYPSAGTVGHMLYKSSATQISLVDPATIVNPLIAAALSQYALDDISPSPAGTYFGVGEITVNSKGLITGISESTENCCIIDSSVLNKLYPIGSVYFSTVDYNPSLHLGGTWVSIGNGKFIASVGTDVDDNGTAKSITVGANGGEYTHRLTIGELPTHSHTVSPASVTSSSGGTHTHSIDPPSTTTTSDGAHTHRMQYFCNEDGDGIGGGVETGTSLLDPGAGDVTGLTTTSNGSHNHTVNIASFTSGSGGAHTHTITIPAFNSGNVGSSQYHNVTPPSFGLYVWSRTA